MAQKLQLVETPDAGVRDDNGQNIKGHAKRGTVGDDNDSDRDPSNEQSGHHHKRDGVHDPLLWILSVPHEDLASKRVYGV
ncbi:MULTISPECIES: hypothetical protein [Methylobacterium]|uniref:hypothetical protein n=1 Tax=Methylobacterium TaxID=407 RepID=UPI00257BD126|nr:hypothetical protein [Methylobacterium sp.]